MPSFDIVSKLDMQEVENAIFNASKEINQRYDFKGSKTDIERNENLLTCLLYTSPSPRDGW